MTHYGFIALAALAGIYFAAINVTLVVALRRLKATDSPSLPVPVTTSLPSRNSPAAKASETLIDLQVRLARVEGYLTALSELGLPKAGEVEVAALNGHPIDRVSGD